jgi:2-aminoethylphosphonate-pyruvate transaminase
VVESDWLSPPDLAAVERALRPPDVEAVAVVHHETTTGLLNPVAQVGRLARAAGKLLLVDSVSGLGGDRLDLEEVSADAVVGTAGKCIQAFPGIAFVLVREAALSRLAANPRRSLYLSLPVHHDAQRRGTVPFTPAVQLVYALDEALAELLDEGVAARIGRYRAAADLLRAGFARLGLSCLLPPELRSNSITALRLPAGHTYASLHDGLKAHGFVVYEGQGRLAKDVFRVANMGHLTAADFASFLDALAAVLGA